MERQHLIPFPALAGDRSRVARHSIHAPSSEVCGWGPDGPCREAGWMPADLPGRGRSALDPRRGPSSRAECVGLAPSIPPRRGRASLAKASDVGMEARCMGGASTKHQGSIVAASNAALIRILAL